MNLTNVRLKSLLCILGCIAASIFLPVAETVGVLLLAILFQVRFLYIDTGESIPDLTKYALVLKTIRKGNVAGTLAAWCGMIYVLLVQLEHGKLQMAPVYAFLLLGAYGFYAGAAYHLLFKWSQEAQHLSALGETALLCEVRRERKALWEFNPITFPKRCIFGYDL